MQSSTAGWAILIVPVCNSHSSGVFSSLHFWKANFPMPKLRGAASSNLFPETTVSGCALAAPVLMKRLTSLLGCSYTIFTHHDLQVFDISESSPEKVVQRMYDHLETLKTQEIKGAVEMQSQLRVLLMGDHKRVYRTLQVCHDLSLVMTTCPPLDQ